MFTLIKKIYLFLITLGTLIQPFLLLAIRLFWGWRFFQSGLEKFSNIGHVIEFFQSLSIPFPTINAYIAASIELIGGVSLMLGLASRLASIPLMIVMIVAMATAHHDALLNVFQNPEEFTQQSPFIYFLVVLIVFAFGPGAFSLDALLKRYVFKKGP